MPFTPPSTVASKANTGYLAQLILGSPAVAVSEIKSFTVDPISMPEVNKSHLLSPNNTEEFSPGMIKPGKVKISGNFIGDASQLQIETLAKAQSEFTFSVVAPVQKNTKTYTGSGSAYFASYTLGPFENNKTIDYMAELQITGTYDENVA